MSPKIHREIKKIIFGGIVRLMYWNEPEKFVGSAWIFDYLLTEYLRQAELPNLTSSSGCIKYYTVI